MSEFEFVQVTVAIILGLGITELLRNIGVQIRKRSEIQVCSLQIAASSLLVLVILRYLWVSWSTLEVSWDLPLFFLTVCPAIALALAAQVISVDWDSGSSPQEQYFSNSTATYLFWAAAPLGQIVFDLVLHGTLSLLDTLRFVVVALLVSMAFSRNLLHHWVILSILFISLLVGVPLSQFSLTGGGG